MQKYVFVCQAFTLFLAGIFAAPAWGENSGVSIHITPEPVEQGGVALIRVTSPHPLGHVRGDCGGEAILFYPDGKGGFASLVGIDLDQKPGERPLHISARAVDGQEVERSVPFKVLKKDFPVQRLTLPKGMVDLTPKDLARVKRENAKVAQVLNAPPTERQWRSGFKPPLEGDLISSFGLRRVLNGQPRSPHSGVDFRAAMGEPVRTSGDGTVVYTADHFFSGNSVFVDHGMGIFTMYFHLSKIEVKKGDRVVQGQVIGKAGRTGRATGPHLHWAVRLHGSRVDPFALLALFRQDVISESEARIPK